MLPAPRSPDGRTIREDRLILAGHGGAESIMPVTNPLERLNEEIKRRTRVVRIFPNAASCLRLVRALAVETRENWLEANRYLNMEDLKEQKKLLLREAA
jgi:putative transposase